jgi:hypothetical protein
MTKMMSTKLNALLVLESLPQSSLPTELRFVERHSQA